MNSLINYFNNIAPINNDITAFLARTVERLEFDKNEPILEAGEEASHMYFIDQGLVTFTFAYRHETRHVAFRKKGEIIFFGYSLISSFRSEVSIIPLQKTVAYQLTYKNLKQLCNLYPDFHYYIFRIMQRNIDFDEVRLRILDQITTKNKCKQLLLYDADLARIVTIRYLSSFMNVSPRSLHRCKYLLRPSEDTGA